MNCDNAIEECFECLNEDFNDEKAVGDPFDDTSKQFYCGEAGEQLGCERFEACFETSGACRQRADGTFIIDTDNYPECKGAQPCGTCYYDSPCGVQGANAFSRAHPGTFVATEACLISQEIGLCRTAGACFSIGCSDGVFLRTGDYFMTCSAVAHCAACFPYSSCGIPMRNTTEYAEKIGPWKMLEGNEECERCARYANCYHLGCDSGTMMDVGLFEYCTEADVYNCSGCYPYSSCGKTTLKVGTAATPTNKSPQPDLFVAPSSTCTSYSKDRRPSFHIMLGCHAAAPCFENFCSSNIKMDICSAPKLCAGCYKRENNATLLRVWHTRCGSHCSAQDPIPRNGCSLERMRSAATRISRPYATKLGLHFATFARKANLSLETQLSWAFSIGHVASVSKTVSVVIPTTL